MILFLILAFVLAFAVSVIVGRVLIPKLRAMKAGQSIREDGPKWHMSKSGTPTMGGLMFIAAVFLVCFTVGIPQLLEGNWAHIFVLVFAMIFGAIGFLDDYEKVKKKQNLGLTAIQKFLLQLAVAVVFIVLMCKFGYLTPNLYIPFFNVTVPLSEWLYIVLAAFIIVGCVNAVNITDGIDGLCAGVTIPVALCYGVIAFMIGNAAVGIVAGALAGALIGFLIYNFHPAKVFMGDTGSLFLGGAVCAMAFALDMPLILIPLGIVYIVETLSDIIQVVYFKLTHGKRIFKMAPLHHHFEMSGWSEVKIFTVFSLVSLVFAVISFFAVAGKY